MARNREALVLLLDVGPSMHTVLPEVEKLCSMLFCKKLLYNKFDEVGVVVFGTQETNNELSREVGGYNHIVVLSDIRVVDEKIVEAVQPLPRGTIVGDFLDAVVVGMDMVIKKYGETMKGKKRLCLISNAIGTTKDPYQGTKDDQVSTIAAKMAAEGIRLENIIVRGKLLTADADKTTIEENDQLLSLFSTRGHGKTVYVESSTSLLGAIRTRNISPVTLFRGDLEIGPNMKIKVWVYKKTAEEKFPTLQKYSDKAPSTDKFATHEIKVDTEYKSVEDPGKVVPPEQRIKGYRYGPQVVPISADQWDAVKFKPEKSVKLLGFSDASNIMRHYYMKDVNIFIAEPGNTKAILAASAIARAMKEMNKVAILRCVWRQNQGNVVVGVLTPNISEREDIPDSFYFNVLPFAEDVREFQFPSISKLPASLQPNQQQQEAADNLVKMLDLAPPSGEEALKPDFVPNPVLERFYCHLELKSKQPDAPVPPLDNTLKMITEPDEKLLSEHMLTISEFRGNFEVKENPKLKKSSRRFLRERPSGSDDEAGNKKTIAAQDVNSTENKSLTFVDKIGEETPIQDFETMMSRRDSPDWVVRAITEMKSRILMLMGSSYVEDNAFKAMECLVALRKGCVLEQEPNQFNGFLLHLQKLCQEKNFGDFCQNLASKDIKLIPKSEAMDSDVTDDEAKQFLIKYEPKTEY